MAQGRLNSEFGRTGNHSHHRRRSEDGNRGPGFVSREWTFHFGVGQETFAGFDTTERIANEINTVAGQFFGSPSVHPVSVAEVVRGPRR